METVVLDSSGVDHVRQETSSSVVALSKEATVILSSPLGPPGPPGPPGPIGTAEGAFLVVNRFYEISDNEEAKAAARQNLGLQIIDGGTFF